MSKQILVNASHYETRVAFLENGEIRQLHIEREEDKNVVGNIYLGVVKRVLPGMQAAFLELGLERTAFLYVDDIIDEPFGSDVDYLEDDGSADTSAEYADDEEPGRPRPQGSEEGAKEEGTEDPEASAQDLAPLVIEDDAEPAPIFVAPSLPEAEASEDETEANDEEEESEEDEGDEEDFDNDGPEVEVDFQVVDEPEETVSAPTVANETPAPTAELRAEASQEVTATVQAEGESASDRRPRDERREEFSDDRQEAQAFRGPRPEDDFEDDHEGPAPGNEREHGPREGGGTSGGEGGRRPRHRGGRGGRNRRGRGRHREGGSSGDERRTDDRRPEGRRPQSDRGGEDRDYRPERDGRNDREGRNDRGNSDRDSRNDRGDRSHDRGDRQERQGRAPRRGPRGQRRGGNRRRFSRRRPRGSANIQDLLKEGQEILVQVAKAPIGTKGARLTTHISLPGRNLVLMPTVKHLGISRRISSDRERRRLRDIFTKRLQVKNIGFIIRTVADGKSFRELKADADYLIQTWLQIKKDAKAKRAPALIHEDLSLPFRAVRDFFTEEVDSFVIDNSSEYEGILKFIGPFMPRLKSRVKLFKGPSQLFEHYGIEAEISRALNKKVWLKSGGYLLVDQSEALTAIDVNTGRYVGSKSLEETIFKTNLEAVKEIAYQLRIRNVGGIIIIDLIDMESNSNREKVFNALHEALSEDKSKTNILKISELGLVEMTRKRTHEDLVRYLTEACPSCDGRGYTKSRRTVAFEIFREIEKEALSNTRNIMVFASPGVVSLLSKEENRHVGLLEKRFNKSILIKADPEFHTEQFEVFGKH